MRPVWSVAAAVTVGALLFTTGCAPLKTIETLSTAQTCARANEVLTDMANVLVKAAVNPLAVEVYVGRLRELSDEIRALEPLDGELKAALQDTSDSADALLDVTDLSNPMNLLEAPKNIAQLQISLRKVLDKCEQLTSV